MSKYIKITDFGEVYDFHIKKRRFAHDEISFRARLTENQSKEWGNLSRKVIRADVVEDSHNQDQEIVEKNVFLGNVHTINMNLKASWFCDITAYSFSVLMDKEPKSRIFQNCGKNLLDILKDVCREYKGIVIKDQGVNKISVPDPIIQYQETDWHFLLRMTKKYGLDIVVSQDDENVNEGTLWIGNIDRRPKEISDNMLVGKTYSEKGMTYKCNTTDIFDVGDNVLYHGKEYKIISCDFYLDHNALIREYTFCSEADREEICPWLRGLILKAEVLALEGAGKNQGQIQVKFDLEKDNPRDPVWIDWVTPFCDGNTGIYNMPAVGETVLIRAMNEDGTELIAENNLRTTQIDQELHVTDKLLRVGDKQILFNDEQISIKNKSTSVILENENVTIHTETGSWILNADGLSIDIDGKPVNIKSDDVKIDGNNIDVSCKKINVISDDINLKGMVKVTS